MRAVVLELRKSAELEGPGTFKGGAFVKGGSCSRFESSSQSLHCWRIRVGLCPSRPQAGKVEKPVNWDMSGHSQNNVLKLQNKSWSQCLAKCILKFLRTIKNPNSPKRLKKEDKEGTVNPDFKIHHEATVIKAVW